MMMNPPYGTCQLIQQQHNNTIAGIGIQKRKKQTFSPKQTQNTQNEYQSIKDNFTKTGIRTTVQVNYFHHILFLQEFDYFKSLSFNRQRSSDIVKKNCMKTGEKMGCHKRKKEKKTKTKTTHCYNTQQLQFEKYTFKLEISKEIRTPIKV